MWILSDKFGTDVFERDALRRAHEENQCHLLGRDMVCSYCLVAEKNKPELTSEMIEVNDPSMEL